MILQSRILGKGGGAKGYFVLYCNVFSLATKSLHTSIWYIYIVVSIMYICLCIPTNITGQSRPKERQMVFIVLQFLLQYFKVLTKILFKNYDVYNS